MASYLLLVTIGPVQEFIAAARRTRDLWAGSQLLSDLSRKAAETIQRDGGEVTLIFPPQTAVQNADSSLANVANKLLATVSADPQTLGPAVVNAVQAQLQTFWSDPERRSGAREQFAGRINTSAAELQIADLLEVYWVAVELPAETAYAGTRRQVEALMAARKTTRDFAPVTWGEQVPKSSIDGQREAVIAEDQYAPPGSSPERRTTVAKKLYEQYRAGPAERLSGVDLLKRHVKAASGTQHFPSTADVAVRPLLARLSDTPGALASWTTYLAEIEYLAAGRLREERVAHTHPVIGQYDGGLLLESRLYELIEQREEREQAGRALAHFYRTLELPRPEPYYAILLADGDRMGATIDNQTTLPRHLELSRRLGEFAGKARTILVQYKGALVYAGGDDVLAFVPLHTLLACATELHAAFGTTINPDPQHAEPFVDKYNQQPTLSVGIAICHQIEPLSDALALARAAEQAAKGVPGKDALALTLSKRSGADVTISGKWGVLDSDLATFTRLHRIDTLPDGAAFQLRDLAERLTPKQGDPTLPAEATLGEARRIIGRKQPKRGVTARLADATLAKLHKILERPPMRLVPEPAESSDAARSKAALATVRSLADALIVARVFAVAADHADEPLEMEA